MIWSLALSSAAVLSLAAASPILAQPAPSTSDFVTAALQTDDYERQAGRIAENSAYTGAVRGFGVMMVRDHTRTAQDLKAAIERTGHPAPPDPKLTKDQLQMLNALRYANGYALFDSTYVNQQVRTHQQALALMQAYAQGGEDPALRAAAANAVPLVQQHLQMAQELAKNLR